MKSMYNITVTQNGVIEILGSSTESGKFRYVNNKLEFSNNGTHWALIEDITTTKVLVVNAISGNNSTAKKGSFSFAYKSITGAKASANAGDLIYVISGNYTDSNILKDGVDMYFEQGAIVTSSTAIMSDAVATKCSVKGFGSFISSTSETAAGTATNHAIVLSNTSDIEVEALEVSSYSIQGVAKLKISNAIIGKRGINSIVSIGDTATVTINNCKYMNYNAQIVHNVGNFLYTAINTTYKQGTTQNAEIKTIGTPNAGSPSGQLVFSECKFKSDVNNMIIGQTTNNGTARFVITFDNCRLFTTATNSIHTNATVADLHFINDNVSNKDLGGTLLTNSGNGIFYVQSTLKIEL
jgi:hypothetical protein